MVDGSSSSPITKEAGCLEGVVTALATATAELKMCGAHRSRRAVGGRGRCRVLGHVSFLKYGRV